MFRWQNLSQIKSKRIRERISTLSPEVFFHTSGTKQKGRPTPGLRISIIRIPERDVGLLIRPTILLQMGEAPLGWVFF
jgi:hypothetical protein